MKTSAFFLLFANTMACSVDPKFGETIKKQSPLITNAYVDGTHVVPLENPDILGKY